MIQLKRGYYRKMYLVAAIYDLILGFLFLFFYKPLMEFVDMSVPADASFLSAAAMFIFIFGILLFMIYLKPEGSRRMVIYSIIMKIGYMSVVGFYFVKRNFVLDDWPFLVFAVLDLIFLVLFAESLRFIKD